MGRLFCRAPGAPARWGSGGFGRLWPRQGESTFRSALTTKVARLRSRVCHSSRAHAKSAAPSRNEVCDSRGPGFASTVARAGRNAFGTRISRNLEHSGILLCPGDVEPGRRQGRAIPGLLWSPEMGRRGAGPLVGVEHSSRPRSVALRRGFSRALPQMLLKCSCAC